MSMVSIVVCYDGSWSESHKYEGYKVADVVVSTDISLTSLIESVVDVIPLDIYWVWHLFVVLDQEAIQLNNDRDVFWFLNMARNVSEPSCPLIISNHIPGAESSRTGVIGDNFTSEYYADDTPTTVAMFEEIDFGRLPPDFDVAVNYVYATKSLLQKAMAIVAIKNNFQFKVVKSSLSKLYLVCADANCGWLMSAAAINDALVFKIKKYISTHTCSLDSMGICHRQASSAMIGECIKDVLISSRGKIMDPTEIADYFKRRFNYFVPYQKAWRARIYALDLIRGSSLESYSLLPIFAHQLCRVNPGSITDYYIDGNGHFQYFFMAIAASIQGWSHCRPVISIDGTFLTGHFKGTMLIACTLDVNNQIFPLALAIVDSENDNSYIWFFQNLRKALGTRSDLVIVSDRHQSIQKATKAIYPEAMHVFCIFHLGNNLAARFHQGGASVMFGMCARAYSIDEFNRYMRSLDAINPAIRGYLEEIGFEKWSRCYSKHSRYHLMTTNISESLNKVFKNARGQPVVYIVQFFRSLLQSWFVSRREKAAKTSTTLSYNAELVLRQRCNNMGSLTVQPIDTMNFEVICSYKHFTVNLTDMFCSCGVWTHEGIPCTHACAVIRSKDESVYSFVSKWYFNTELCEVYKGVVNPVGSKEQWVSDLEIEDMNIKPPNMKRPAGRPRTERMKSTGEFKSPKNKYRCSRCGRTGHNKHSCKNPIPADWGVSTGKKMKASN